MTSEKIEAHRAQFEQRFYAEFGLEPLRSGPGYVEAAASDAWLAYKWAVEDCTLQHITEFGEMQERALSHPESKVADSGVIAAPVAGMNLLKDVEQYIMQQPAVWDGMSLLKAVRAAIKAGEQAAQPLQQSAQPVAWHVTGCHIIFWDQDDAAREARQIGGTTRAFPVYAAAQPVEVQPSEVPDGVWEALQRLIENGTLLGPASAEDALVVATYRDRAKFMVTKPAQPVEVQRVPLTEDQRRRLLGGAFAEEWAQEAANELLDDVESHFVIKPTSEGGAK